MRLQELEFVPGVHLGAAVPAHHRPHLAAAIQVHSAAALRAADAARLAQAHPSTSISKGSTHWPRYMSTSVPGGPNSRVTSQGPGTALEFALTLVALLLRLYDPENGQVTIDGQDIREVRKASLRRQLGIVLQDTFLFSGTVADNIRYGPALRKRELPDARIALVSDREVVRGGFLPRMRAAVFTLFRMAAGEALALKYAGADDVKVFAFEGEGVAEVVGQGFLGGEGLGSDLDVDGAVAPRGADEALDGPAGGGLDVPGGHRTLFAVLRQPRVDARRGAAGARHGGGNRP